MAHIATVPNTRDPPKEIAVVVHLAPLASILKKNRTRNMSVTWVAQKL